MIARLAVAAALDRAIYDKAMELKLQGVNAWAQPHPAEKETA